MEKIKPPSADLLAPYRTGKKMALLVGYALICLMMISLAVGVVFAGTRLIAGWKGFYLVGLALFLSIEAIYARKRIVDFDQREKIIFRITEWIAFAVLIKIILYLVNGPEQLLEDIPLWQKAFLESFFTAEYVLALFISLLVWWTSSAHSAEIEQLYDAEKDAEWEDLGKVQNSLREARNRISSRIFFVGTLLVVLAVISRLEISFRFSPPGVISRSSILPIANVLVYFVLGTVLLTQTQFVLLRSRWIHQRLHVSTNLARNWMKYSLAFFLILAVIVIFLPTNYSLGLFETLQVALGYLAQVASFIFILITLPIAFCLSLFSFGNKQTPESPSGAIGGFPAAPADHPLAWWEFIKSLAFWIIFLGVIFFALRYYFMQNTGLWRAIRNVPFFHWLSTGWNNIIAWFQRANQQIGAKIGAGIKRFRAQRVNLPVPPLRKIINLSRLSPREKVFFYYSSLILLGGDRGLRRAPSQTPEKYRQLLSQVIPEVDAELVKLTDTFVEARYSQHPVEEPSAVQAGGLWERIKAVLRSWQKNDSSK